MCIITTRAKRLLLRRSLTVLLTADDETHAALAATIRATQSPRDVARIRDALARVHDALTDDATPTVH